MVVQGECDVVTEYAYGAQPQSDFGKDTLLIVKYSIY